MKKTTGLACFLLAVILIFVLGTAVAESLTGSLLTLGQWEGHDLNWLVLAEDGNRALLYLDGGLAAQPYNTDNKAVTWQTCTLRQWLQNTFCGSAFSPSEAAAICTVLNENPVTYGTDGGGETVDTVFLLSRSELEAYFPVLKDRKISVLTMPDPTAKTGTVVFVSPYDLTSPYWLRSPGVDEKHACAVSWTGIIESHGVKAATLAVRPAVWVDLTLLGLK